MNRIKIVIADYFFPNLNHERTEFRKLGNNVEIVDCTKILPGGIKDPRQLIEYSRDCDGLIVQYAKVDAQFIGELTKCKVIAGYGIGVDTIDTQAAKSRGIWVANVPDYCISEVANTAAMHILNATRKLTTSRDMLIKGYFDRNNLGSIFRLEDATLALLGFGNIARDLYMKMKPFFRKAIVYDPYFTGQSNFPDVSFQNLDKTLSSADVISIHVPLNTSTRGLLSTNEFHKMKNGVIIINTARGAIIDEEALLNALNSGKVGFAGLDVLTIEDYMNSPFLNHERVALTPHLAWYSTEAQVELQVKTARNVVEAILNGKPLYPI